MPITINQNKVKFKHPTQQGFIEFNSVAEKTTEQLKEELRETATEISASWPQNAQDLTNKVNQLVKFQNTAPATSSATQIWVDTSNNTEQVGIPTLEDIAPIFDKNTTYKDGQYVWHDTHLYKFITDHAAGSWAGTDVIQIVLSNDLGSQINDLKSAISVEQSTISTTESEPYVGYWGRGADGVVLINSNSIYKTLEHPIDISALSPGVKVSVLATLNTASGVFITDANFNSIDFVSGYNAEEKGYMPSKPKPQRVVLTVPQNAKYIMTSINNSYYTGLSDFDVTVYDDSIIDLRNRMIAAESDISSIDERIDKVESDIGIESTTLHPTDETAYGGYWGANSNTLIMQIVNSNSYSTIEHPIDISSLKAGTNVSIKSSITGGIGVYIFDKNNKLLVYANGNNRSEHGYSSNTDARLITLTVPEGAAYIVSAIKNDKLSGISDFDVHGTLKNNLDHLEDKIYAFSENTEKEVLLTSWSWETGYVNGNNVEGSSSSFRRTEYIDVRPYKKIRIEGLSLSNSSDAGIVMVDANRASVVTYYTNNPDRIDDSDHYINATIAARGVPVPDGAIWMRASQRSNALDGYFIYGIIDYAETAINLMKADPYPELPCANIIRDGGFCKIFKTIGVVGDSLSSGSMHDPASGASTGGEDETVVDKIWYSWIQQMARYTGSTAYNFSMGGLSAHTIRYSLTNQNVQQIIADLEDPNKKCNAYFIALGHNDKTIITKYPDEYSLGTIADIDISNSENNADTYYGNIGWVISKIISLAPGAKIFLITMKGESTFGVLNEALRMIPNLFNTSGNRTVYLLDMSTYAPKKDSTWEYLNGHGSPQGYLNYSWQVSSYVDWYIRHYPNEFKLTAFYR